MKKETKPTTDELAQSFVETHRPHITGVLHGFDRIRFQGTFRSLYHRPSMEWLLARKQVLFKDFRDYVSGYTNRLRQSAADLAARYQRPFKYLPGSSISKEAVAKDLVQNEPVDNELGLAAVLSCVEPCRSWSVHPNGQTKRLELRLQWRKCLHLYFYFEHPLLGWLHVRLQTWFPFLIQICLNGRHWLARQLERAGIGFRKADNSFAHIDDLGAAQRLMDQQAHTHWPEILGQLADHCHPTRTEITSHLPKDYYWTIAQSEYAIDLMFAEREKLDAIYSTLTRHSMLNLGSEQVLRYMGRPSGPRLHDDQHSDQRRGPDGLRVKHWLNENRHRPSHLLSAASLSRAQPAE